MSILSFFSLLGGLAMFLYGMTVMGDSLQKISGGRMKSILSHMTDTPLKRIVLGTGVTAVIQSSSATTVMVVGFVNSGIMNLTQAIGVIMGANIGTTVTSWILSLTGIEGDSLIVKLCKPDSFAPLLAFIGVALILFSKKKQRQDVGGALMGFAILMSGMSAMSAAVKPLANVPEFTQLFTLFENPIMGVLVGALVTAVIQSSSASVGILQALCMTGSVSYLSAIPIILGQNIGTCVTALLSCIGASKNAKRAAMVHLYFNIIGVVVLGSLFYLVQAFFPIAMLSNPATPFGIAVCHSGFNLLSTAMLCGFQKQLKHLACLTIPDRKAEKAAATPLLDDRLLATPSIAIAQSRNACATMAQAACEGMTLALGALTQYSEDACERIAQLEGEVDHLEDVIGTYLLKISNKSLSDADNQEVSIQLHCLSDWERISDHSLAIMRSVREMHDKQISFSDACVTELRVLERAAGDIVKLTTQVFLSRDVGCAAQVEPLEQVIDALKQQLHARHVARLRAGDCTIELGFILNDILTALQRVSDHCSNIAVAVIQLHDSAFNTHAYLNDVKLSGGRSFSEAFKRYESAFTLPPEI